MTGPTPDGTLRSVLFESLLSHADAPREILPRLVDAAVEHAGADAAAVVLVSARGDARVEGARNLPEALSKWHGDVETIDSELGDRLRVEGGGNFAISHTLPMVSGRDLFGALILFVEKPPGLEPSRLMLAQSLTGLVAMSLSKAMQYDELKRGYAELRVSRETLERTQKLRALGQMAAGVSHDLKNILNPLSLSLQLLQRIIKKRENGAGRGSSAEIDEAIADMQKVLRRGLETIERLRDFSRQSPESRFELVDVNRVVAEAIDLCRPRLRTSDRADAISLVAELGEAPRVVAREADFVAALVNIIVNAIDALRERGHIVVSTGGSDGGAWVRVADDGPGIAEVLRPHIFEPFFTTKGTEGTGLGLAIVYSFAERHGGRLTLDSAPTKGATFTLWFPAARDSTPPQRC